MSVIVLTGHLCEDAQARSAIDGQQLVMVRVLLPPSASLAPVQVRAVKQFGTGPAAAIAARISAHHLRRGVRVVLSGGSLSLHRGYAMLHRLDALRMPDLVVARHAAAGDE